MPKLLDSWPEINNLGLLFLVLFIGVWVTIMPAPTIIHLQIFAAVLAAYCAKIGIAVPAEIAKIKAGKPQ